MANPATLVETTPCATSKPVPHKEISRGRALVLSYLMKLNKSIDAQHADLAHALTHRFSECLIDYISYGHFRLFEAYPPQAHQVAALENITAQALAFSDRYTHSESVTLSSLKDDLEALALAIEVRFEIEDEMLNLVVA